MLSLIKDEVKYEGSTGDLFHHYHGENTEDGDKGDYHGDEKYDIFVIHKVYPNVKNNNNLFFWIGMVYLKRKNEFR